jgi:uncharacterized protein (TIGR00299 family) protein
MTPAAWWHCFSGIAGDMALASLLDAGADPDIVVDGLNQLGLKGWGTEVSKTRRGPLTATRVQVHIDPSEASTERSWGAIRGILDQPSSLPERALNRARRVFGALAEAEGRLHGLPPDEVHFHEVGGLDAIIDVVGTCLALESLDIGTLRSSPVTLGTGTVGSAHGVLPNPAPAVVALLKGVPVRGSEETAELTTPTGAALVTALCDSFGPIPTMKVQSWGYGAGSRELAGMPNVLQVVVGELTEPAPDAATWQELALLETNVDDVTGETLGYTIARLLQAGALDAWATPVVGKKGRPGHLLSALADPSLAPMLAEVVTTETGALGLRQQMVQRRALPRRTLEVEVEGERVRVKAGPYRLKAEHDDCIIAASHLGLPAREVARRAEEAARLMA